MASNILTCPEGHGGPGTFDSLGWEGRVNTVRCRECNSVFDVDHSGSEPEAVYEQSNDSDGGN